MSVTDEPNTPNTADLLELIHTLRADNERLKALEQRYELALEASRDGLWDWNLSDNTIYFSPQWKAMVGYTDDELPNALSTWESLVHPEDLEGAIEAVEESINNPEVRYAHTHRLRHKEGHYIWNYDHGKVLYNEQGRAVRMIGLHTDITHIKELEKELNETQELMISQSRHAAMGEMIGMIAHQWRQPLSVISMGVNNLIIDVELGGVEEDACLRTGEVILSQVEYLSRTIDDFRDFFRPDKEVEPIRIVDVITEGQSMIDASLKNNGIDLILRNESDSVIVTHSRELLQVFVNILKNAKEALMGGETLNPKIEIRIFEEGDSIVTQIHDNGPQIPEAVLPKIFDPYFTTKDEKTGTGLGLYMSKTIVEKHLRGSIAAKNCGGGVCFTVTLPKAQKGQ
jgi:PAS domain S-box-containing protein